MVLKNEKLNDTLLWVFVVFSGFYINLFYIKPVYIAVFLGIIGYIFFEMKTFKNITWDKLSIFTIIWIVYMSISFIFISGYIGTTLNSIMSVFTYFIGVQYLKNRDENRILKISRDFINISIVLLIVEAAIRISHPRVYDLSFYRYKFNSIMYEDSNYVGIFIICLIFYSIYLSKYKSEKYIWQKIVLFLLCIATFSRAAIISTLGMIIALKIFDILYNIAKKLTKKQKITISIIMGLITIIICFLVVDFLLRDGSFRSKFYIAELAIKHLKHSNLNQILFGVGFGKTYDYIGIGAHNIVIAYTLESGIIGLIFFIMFTVMIAIKTNGKSLIITIPFLMAGMSLAGFTLPFLYIIYAMIYILENERGRLDSYEQ